ncbi:hypothetical protein D3C83_258050 [compost metagenome]
MEPVAAQEPVERPLRPQAVLGVSRHGERRQLGLDERRRVERLLVAGSRRRLAAVPAAVSRQPQRAFGQP